MNHVRRDITEPRRWYARFGVLEDGRIVGEIEHSFSMAFSFERVRVFDDYYGFPMTPWPNYVEKLPYFFNDGIKTYKIVRFFIVRVSGKVKDFEIDWSPRLDPNCNKFNWRNLSFSKKE